MKYQYWKCFCGSEFRTSTTMSEFDLRDHMETHKKEYAELQKAEHDYNHAVNLASRKYVARYFGHWIENVTPPVVRKLWKCKRCGEEMGYHHKFHHVMNAQRNGKDYACKSLATQPESK